MGMARVNRPRVISPARSAGKSRSRFETAKRGRTLSAENLFADLGSGRIVDL
jgi:hypothetical protein